MSKAQSSTSHFSAPRCAPFSQMVTFRGACLLSHPVTFAGIPQGPLIAKHTLPPGPNSLHLQIQPNTSSLPTRVRPDNLNYLASTEVGFSFLSFSLLCTMKCCLFLDPNFPVYTTNHFLNHPDLQVTDIKGQAEYPGEAHTVSNAQRVHWVI